ncbi:MAG TPA: PAS domain S-box protein [Geobacteraceae bacterium]|nr:PAS domain S-box protein [Geobacteraceae bacterium]
MLKDKKVPLVIASLYACIAAAWIYFSDMLLASIASDRAQLTAWAIYKGWFYVAVTSVLLYWIIWHNLKKLIAAREALENENRECRFMHDALRDSEEQFHNMFAKHRAVMYLVDTASLGIFDANEAARKFYGYSGEQFRQLKINDLNTHSEEEIRKSIDQQLIGEGLQTQFRHRLADGSIRDVEIYATKIRLTNREFYFIIVHDISERIKYENALRESEARFRSLVETTSDWIWELDENDAYVYASPKVKDLLGYEPAEVMGKTPFDFIAVHEIGEIRRKFKAFKEAAKPFAGLENRNVHKDGRIVVLETSAVPVFDSSGRFAGYRGIDRDITGHKLLEEQLLHAQKMEAVGELAGGIAHDFNNILTTIIGYVFILENKIEDESLKKHVAQISFSAQRAATLVSKLLAFSRKQIICLQPVRINDTINTSVKLLSRVIREDVEIRTELKDEDIVVLGDEGQLEQVIMNLVTNARDAMPSGGVLTIKTCMRSLDGEFTRAHGYGEPGAYGLISFADTGVGMDEKTRERIFEPFFTTKEVGKGTGLGLSVVYGIIKQHSGYIDVSSEPGKGSTFYVYLPLAGNGGSFG